MIVIVVGIVGLKINKSYHVNCFVSKRLLWWVELFVLRLKNSNALIVLLQTKLLWWYELLIVRLKNRIIFSVFLQNECYGGWNC